MLGKGESRLKGFICLGLSGFVNIHKYDDLLTPKGKVGGSIPLWDAIQSPVRTSLPDPAAGPPGDAAPARQLARHAR